MRQLHPRESASRALGDLHRLALHEVLVEARAVRPPRARDLRGRRAAPRDPAGRVIPIYMQAF